MDGVLVLDGVTPTLLVASGNDDDDGDECHDRNDPKTE